MAEYKEKLQALLKEMKSAKACYWECYCGITSYPDLDLEGYIDIIQEVIEYWPDQ